MKKKSYLIIGLLMTFIMVLANPFYKEIRDTQCSILTDSTLSEMKELLEKQSYRVLTYSTLKLDYRNVHKEGFGLIDNTHRWELFFSDKYSDIEIKYSDSNFVVLYSAMSGIINALSSSSIKSSNLFVINRKSSKKILNISSQKGIVSGILKDNFLFLRCHKPDVVRYFSLK